MARVVITIQAPRASLYGFGAGGPAAFRHVLPHLPADQRFLLAFPLVATICVVVAGRSPSSRRPRSAERPAPAGGLGRSRAGVRRLAALFAAIVDPSERIAAAAYTNSARYLGRPAGPAVAGALMQRTAVAAPFLAAAAIKVADDLAVYARFRRIEAPLS